MNIHQAFIWFGAIESLVLDIHLRIYKGSDKKNRYRFGRNYIVEVSDNKMVAIHNFENRKSIRIFHDEINLSVLDKVSSLAENVTAQIPQAIKNISHADVYNIYQRADRLNTSWIDVRFQNIIKNLMKH